MDIELGLLYLYTRVLCSTNRDWEKLRRLLVYLKDTIDMLRITGANGLNIFQTWLDVSYAIHQDMKGNTGEIVSMGHGIIHKKCSKNEH